jgi:hypothetical protein
MGRSRKKMLLMKLLEENTGRRKQHLQTGRITTLSHRRRHQALIEVWKKKKRKGWFDSQQ